MGAPRKVIVLAVASLVLWLDACGESQNANLVVARVGEKWITKAMVDRWIGVVRHGGAFTGSRGEPRRGTARERALALLISCDWLIGEAERKGLDVSARAVSNALAERAQGEGAAAFRGNLAQKGQTIEGLELELKAELALNALQQELGVRSLRTTSAELVRYYRMHPQMFSTPEARVVDIIEHIPSYTAATALVKRVGAERKFTKLAYHKLIIRTLGVLAGSESKKRVDYAIFFASPGVVSRPMRLGGEWTVFVVRKILPSRKESFADARMEVLRRISAGRPREVREEANREFLVLWQSRTSCNHGYVAPGCPQYRGTLGQYEDPFSDA